MSHPDLAALAPDGLFKSPALLERYSKHFEALRASVQGLFELGVYRGGSLAMWRDFFPDAVIAGLDLKVKELPGDMTRIRFYPGRQDDTALLTRIAEECAPEGFDIIIDDCAHVGTLAKTTFWHLFDNHLKRGGIYVIEDWGTGYWDNWPDGRRFEQRADYDESFGAGQPRRRIFPSHQIGMPGFLKQLFDECALTDILMPGYSSTSYRSPHKPITRLDISLGQAFVFKG